MIGGAAEFSAERVLISKKLNAQFSVYYVSDAYTICINQMISTVRIRLKIKYQKQNINNS